MPPEPGVRLGRRNRNEAPDGQFTRFRFRASRPQLLIQTSQGPSIQISAMSGTPSPFRSPAPTLAMELRPRAPPCCRSAQTPSAALIEENVDGRAAGVPVGSDRCDEEVGDAVAVHVGDRDRAASLVEPGSSSGPGTRRWSRGQDIDHASVGGHPPRRPARSIPWPINPVADDGSARASPHIRTRSRSARTIRGAGFRRTGSLRCRCDLVRRCR